MKKPLPIAIVFGLTIAAVAFAQTGPKSYSNAPTDQDYRLVIVEPQPNATIVGKDIQIVLGGPRTPQGNRYPQNIEDKKQKDVNTPVFQVWVDNKDYGNVPGGQNVFVARDLSYGPHKIVVAAKNISGEVVDRKEIPVTTVESSGSITTRQEAASPPSSSSSSTMEPSAPSPPPPAAGSTAQTLPQTGSAAPLLALVGVILIGSGILLRRS